MDDTNVCFQPKQLQGPFGQWLMQPLIAKYTEMNLGNKFPKYSFLIRSPEACPELKDLYLGTLNLELLRL